MATSLLALLDDIATVLDDVALMTKTAAGRTAGVLGDDLALNAQQVAGVRADRELPVVWAVFKGSARNKLILVPSALLLAAFAPPLITLLLMLGGAYLCYEGFEKVYEKFFHDGDAAAERVIEALRDPDIDLAEFERDKIQGAIRTDFVLSAEIIVISMGTVQNAEFLTQVLTVVAIAIIMTFGVYGLVAGIVKLDDAGAYLIRHSEDKGFKNWLGEAILSFAPHFMKGLTVVGTAAMFLVGGGILAHGIPGLESIFQHLLNPVEEISYVGDALELVSSLLLNGALGIAAGAVLVTGAIGLKKLKA